MNGWFRPKMDSQAGYCERPLSDYIKDIAYDETVAHRSIQQDRLLSQARADAGWIVLQRDLAPVPDRDVRIDFAIDQPPRTTQAHTATSPCGLQASADGGVIW